MTREEYEAQVKELVRRLLAIADEVEREGRRTTNMVDAPPFSWSAHNVVHAVMWGMANANLDGLLLTAAEADEAVRESEPPNLDERTP